VGCIETEREIEVETYWEDRKVYWEVRTTIVKSSPVHVAPTCAGSGEWSNHFGSYVRSLS
jgi:hypothetical protein